MRDSLWLCTCFRDCITFERLKELGKRKKRTGAYLHACASVCVFMNSVQLYVSLHICFWCVCVYVIEGSDVCSIQLQILYNKIQTAAILTDKCPVSFYIS